MSKQQQMTVSEAAKTLRTMNVSERKWVLDLVNTKAIPYEVAVPYVLSWRN